MAYSAIAGYSLAIARTSDNSYSFLIANKPIAIYIRRQPASIKKTNSVIL